MAPSTWGSAGTDGSVLPKTQDTGPFRFLLLCALGGLAVYALGLRQMSVPEAYLATAKVYLELADAAKPAESDQSAIQREVLSDKSLTWAIRRLDLAGETPEQVRQRLSVSAEAEPKRGWLKVAITCRETSRAEPAVGLVNELAESYAQECRNRARMAARSEHAKAREVADRARQEVDTARRRLDTFLEQYFTELDQAPKEEPTHSTGLSEAPAARTDSEKPREAVNPQWLDLSRQLGQLELRRAQLLSDRTPEHPEIQEVEAKMDEIKRQLASVPRQVASEDSAAASGASARTEPSAGRDKPASSFRPAQTRLEAAKTYRFYRNALRQAEAGYERLAQQEREAWRRQLLDTGVALDLAWGHTVVNASVDVRRLLMLALATGLSFAVGSVMISWGCAAGATFSSPRQVHATLGLPVVGTIPSTETSSTICRKLGRAGLLLVVFGLLLLVVGSGIVLGVCRGMFLG